ncbi:MAG: AI-2E family transporter [Candidatus Fermentibacteraceae bacterium]|nr:AI-2E family transporter [Candidatus Fermentibacteraceae bacterium]
MTEKRVDLFKVSLSTVAILIIAVVMKLGAPIFVKIAIAGFFALLISPAVKNTTRWVDNLLRRVFRKYSRRSDKSQSGLADVIGTALVLVMALFIASVFFFLIYGTMSMMVGRKDDMVSNVVTPVFDFVETAQTEWIPDIYSRLGMKDLEQVPFQTDSTETAGEAPPAVVDDSSFSLSSIAPTAAGLVGSVSSALFNTVIIVMLTVFMVNGRRIFSKKIKKMDTATFQRYQELIGGVERVPRKYLLAKLVTSALTGLLIGVALIVMGFQLDEAIIWGTTAMVFNFIPFFGSLAAGVMIALYVMSVHGIQQGVIAAAVVLIINNIVSNVIEPNYFGDVLPIGKVTILLCVIIWGYIWGLLGIFLAVPLTIITKVLLEHLIGRNSLVVLMEV